MMAREYDISLANAQVIWTPVEGVNMPAVQVVESDDDDDDRYISSWGSCNLEFKQATPGEQLTLLMRHFVHLVIAEDIDPSAVHKAFLVIPEYRAALAEDGTLDPKAV